jgi:hypothetical protein
MVDVIVTGYKDAPGPSDEPLSIPREVRWMFQAASVVAKSVFDLMPVGRRIDDLSLLIDCEEDLEIAFEAIPEELRVWM